jgi:hypothetical protein
MYDLPRWQRRKFGLVSGQQDPLALFFAEAVGHMALTAFTPVNTTTISNKLPAPSLQRGEPHAQRPGHLTGTCTLGHTLIQDLQGLLAVVRRSQSSPSSGPPKSLSW